MNVRNTTAFLLTIQTGTTRETHSLLARREKSEKRPFFHLKDNPGYYAQRQSLLLAERVRNAPFFYAFAIIRKIVRRGDLYLAPNSTQTVQFESKH